MDIRSLAKWTWIVVAVAVVYAGSVVFLRWQQNRESEEKAVQKKAASDQLIVDRYASGVVKVMMFYPNPPVIKRGATGLLCYGVANAKKVRIEPDVEPITPSLSRCVEVKPSKDEHYTLTAEDDRGKTATSETNVKVQ